MNCNDLCAVAVNTMATLVVLGQTRSSFFSVTGRYGYCDFLKKAPHSDIILFHIKPDLPRDQR